MTEMTKIARDLDSKFPDTCYFGHFCHSSVLYRSTVTCSVVYSGPSEDDRMTEMTKIEGDLDSKYPDHLLFLSFLSFYHPHSFLRYHAP